MPERIVLDYNNMLAPRLDGRGIDPSRLDAMADRFRDAHAEIARRRAAGELPMFSLPTRREPAHEIRRVADGLEPDVDAVVVLGIGGSALGTIALRDALLPPGWNELHADARGRRPRLYVLDNVDPTAVGGLLDRLDPAATLFNVVSKSGTTAEPMAQFQVAREWLARAVGEDGLRRRFVFTTDPGTGVLRRLADEEGIATLPVPPGVGGRFSVLSPVGLFPAALVGIDVDALLDGAAGAVDRCGADALRENPAGLFAALQYLADAEAGAPIHVMMAYSDRLFAVADWFRQLWAESLGKRVDRRGEVVHRGPTPVKARGATDQHSQVQLYMQGPVDKTITLLGVRRFDRDVEIPRSYPDLEALAYLGGHTLGELLHAEQRATAAALRRAGRMNMTLELPRADASALGELLMTLQIATLYAGAFYDVDPLDQPGVELGKRLTYGLMGRPGYEAPTEPEPDAENICA